MSTPAVEKFLAEWFSGSDIWDMFSGVNQKSAVFFVIIFLALGVRPTLGRTSQHSQSPEQSISNSIRQTLEAFARSDLDSIRRAWTDRSDFGSFKVEFDITQTGYDQIAFLDLRFSRWLIEPGHATVRLSFSMKSRDRSTGKFLLQDLVWDFGLVSFEGGWLISTWDVPRAHLDTRLLQITSRDERLRLLEKEKELLDLKLILSLLEDGDHNTEQGDHSRGANEIEVACEISQVLNRSDGRAACYKVRGDLFSYQYKQSEALVSYERSLILFRGLRDFAGERAVQLGIGNAYVRAGDYLKGLGAFKQALALGRKIPELAGDAVTLKQMGIAYESMGLYDDALDNYGRSLIAADHEHDELAKASTLVNFGNTYFQLGRLAEAQKSYSDALQVYQDLGDERSEAGARINLGNYYAAEGDYEKAHEQYEQSARIGSRIDDGLLIAASTNAMGHVYLLKRQYDQARSRFEIGLRFAREHGMRQEEASRLLELGFVDAITGKDDQALAKYSEAQAIATALRDVDTVFRANNFIGELRLKQRNWPAATAAFQQAIADIERVREHAGSPLLQTSFFAQFAGSYDGLIESSYQMRKYETALNASESAKARTLIEIMHTDRATVNKSLTMAERAHERLLVNSMASITNALDELKDSDSKRVAELNKQLNAARNDYEVFRDRLFVEHPQLRVQRGEFAPQQLKDIYQALFTKNPGLRILSYSVTDHGIFLFVLSPQTRDGSRLKVEMLKSTSGESLTEKELRQRVIDFRQRCSHPDAPYAGAARELYRLLVGPAKEDLKGADQIVIVPSGILLTLPFQALMNEDGQHLLQVASISYAPSITALIEMLKMSRQAAATTKPANQVGKLLAMGVSSFEEIARYRGRNLVWADEQVRVVSRLLGGQGFVGANANEGAAKRFMGRARYVHFVTHGEVNPKAPMFSSIVLRKSGREDGWLFARELMELNLHADLVTLAACQTALGQETKGEGLLGLSWALFVAGAKSSLVTQWEVLDSSTNGLMLDFYENLKKSGFSGKAKALQMAQLNLMKDEKFRHPYYWAPFTLVGDWR